MTIDISNRNITNISKTKLSKIKGIVIHSYSDFFNKKAKFSGFDIVNAKNAENKDYGFHYGLDQYDVVRYVSESYQIKSITTRPTYINNNLFNSKPEESCLAICLFISKEHDYEYTEKKFIELLVKLLKDHKLTAKDIWRGFDLSREDKSPFHILNKEIFSNYISIIEKILPLNNSKEIEKAINEIESPFKDVAKKSNLSINQYILKLYEDNKDSVDAYASKFEPWDKDIEEAKKKNGKTEGELKTKEFPTGNKFQYKVTQNSPTDESHCVKASDNLDGVETTKETMVEPIYPDLITPPGGEIHIADGSSETATQSNSNTPINVEDFEKRQKTFDISKLENVSKKTIGRPINCQDEFPVDKQIKKLEEHFPKVKIDKTKYSFDDDNHPNSIIGNAMAKNLSMCYDMVSEISKRTEQRLVKIENNLSTVMRNLFRLSSRININCVYYGGQSVYGKYKCIRCLNDERTHDGAIVTLDQCLCCTRYEPVLGQVYAILDETGSNIVQVMDDMQMSYMNIDEYKKFSRIEEFWDTPDYANLKENSSEIPKDFLSDKWKDTEKEIEAKKKALKEQSSSDSNVGEKTSNESNNEVKDEDVKNGFIMDWKPTMLETQKPAINEYKTESLEAEKKPISSHNQEIDRDVYVDSRKDAVEYETLEFDVKNYEFDDFGINQGSSGDGNFGMGASEVRKKIVDYAMNAVNLCKDGKALYSQGKRMSHLNNAINGMNYWDCSSLTAGAYNAAGLSEIPINGWTGSIYPFCLTSKGGKLFLPKDLDKALPGDIVWFKSGSKPSTVDGLQSVPYTNGSIVHHVGIYIGNGEYAHASTSKRPPRENILVSKLSNNKEFFAFGRPKSLIELDMKSSQGASGVGYWDRKLHNIPDEIWKLANSAEGNAQKAIDNMNKYKYKDVLISASKDLGYDPYLTLAIAATETGGNPMAGGYGGQLGIMQTDGGRPASTVEGIGKEIRLALSNLNKKKPYLKNCGWTEDNLAVLTHAFNCGEGSVGNATGHNRRYDMPKVNLSTCKIPEIANAMYNYTKKYRLLSMPDARRAYSTKVLRAYIYLYNKKALG